MTKEKILVLADTHNHLPANLPALIRGVSEIWHLGDVCRENVYAELCAAGPPVTLVRGNCDSEFSWPLVADLTRHNLRFRLQHIPPDSLPDKCEVLLHGHTHVPRNEQIGAVRFLNPGCVTRPNRGAPPSVGFLSFEREGKFSWRLLRLR